MFLLISTDSPKCIHFGLLVYESIDGKYCGVHRRGGMGGGTRCGEACAGCDGFGRGGTAGMGTAELGRAPLVVGNGGGAMSGGGGHSMPGLPRSEGSCGGGGGGGDSVGAG